MVASRYAKGGACRGWGLIRRIISKGATFLAHLLLPSTRRFSDPMSGFFILKRQVITGADLEPTGYKILLEMINEGQFQKMAEVPYTFGVRGRGQSKLSARQQIEYLKHLFSLMRRAGELTRFVRFCLVGLSGVGVDEGIFWLLHEFAGLFKFLSATISAEAAIISNFTLNDYFTFRDRRLSGAKSFLNRLVKFNVVGLGGMGIKLAVLWLLTAVFGVHDLLFNLCGIVVAILWNYLVNSWWTWRL